MVRASARQRFKSIFVTLEKQYGRRDRYGSHPPVEQTLVTLLLKNGREEHAVRTIRRLEREFVDWNEVRVCEAELLDQVVGNGSTPGVGALIRDTLTAIFNHSQAMNLDDVMELNPDEAEEKLIKLSPMPSRVAGELLLASLGYKKLPLAAGLLRVARRTKLVGQGAPEDQIKVMRRIVPGAMLSRVFHAMEMLAERVCLPDSYDCRSCPVHHHCPTGTEKLRRLQLQAEKERLVREAEEKQLRKKQEHDHKARAERKALTQKLKQAIEVRSKKLKISTTRKRRRHKKHPAAPVVAARMVQASSAEVRRPVRKKRSRSRRRTRPTKART